MNSASIFFDQTNTLRSGWRFAIFLLAFLMAGTLLGVIAFGAMMASGMSVDRGPVTLAVNAVVWLIPALVIGWLCGKRFERLPFRALGASFTRLWFSHLVMGCVIGAMTVGIAIFAAVAFGGLRFSANPIDGTTIFRSALFALGLFSLAAAFEEALFRGYILQTFARSGLAALAIVMTSIFFGVVHMGNPNVGYIGVANTMLAGIWFGIAYMKTRDLWFVWGMHLVWNWMQGSIFGIEVSGLTDITKASLLTEIDSGPAWLTGGDYGIEGGIACTAALVLSAAAIHFLPILKADEEMTALTSPRERDRTKIGENVQVTH